MYGLILPFKDFDYATGLLKSPWCGFKNFEYLFTNDDVLRATRNTVLYNLVFIVAGMIVALAVALMLFEMSKRVVKVTQTLLLLPFFISYIVVSYAVNGVLDMNISPDTVLEEYQTMLVLGNIKNIQKQFHI